MVALRLMLPACAAVILATACAQSPASQEDAPMQSAAEQVTTSQEVQEDPVVVSDHPMCERGVRLIVNPLVARPGSTLKIFSDHPLGYAPPLDVPDELLTHWRASPQGAATFSADGAQAVVSDTAAPGSTITLTALYCGKREVTTTVHVAAKDEPVIVGYWKQESTECTGMAPPHEPVRELAFEPNGSFSVTYLPFESYKDYWGTHRFDYRTGALDMTVTGGNATPQWANLSGTARLENEKRLVLEDVYLGRTSHPDASCKYVFVK